MRDQIIEILSSRGELKTCDIKILGANPRSLSSALLRMTAAGVVNRRLVDTKKSQQWAYTLIRTDTPYLRNEPDYVYFLRNLGRNDESASIASDC
jgi:hypothetical protein